MSIQEMSSNFKRFCANEQVYLPFVIIVVGIVSFLLGRISAEKSVTENLPTAILSETQQPILPVESEKAIKEFSNSLLVREAVDSNNDSTGGYVASKSGTKYHLPWCSGAKRIKDENKIWFATKAEAEKAGYAPAANCKGI